MEFGMKMGGGGVVRTVLKGKRLRDLQIVLHSSCFANKQSMHRSAIVALHNISFPPIPRLFFFSKPRFFKDFTHWKLIFYTNNKKTNKFPLSWSKSQHKIFRCCYITVYSSTPAPWNGACMKLLYYNAGLLQIDCVILYFHIKANSLQIDANRRCIFTQRRICMKKIIFCVNADFSSSSCFVAVRKKTISFWTDCF